MILVIGSSGFIGSQCLLALKRRDIDTIGVSRSSKNKLDCTNENAVRSFFETIKPNAVIFCAGEPNVDLCEQNLVHSVKQNIDAVRFVSAACVRVGACLILLSTNAVFGEGCHSISDQESPINKYGRHKLLAESIVRQTNSNSSIVRTANVYGWDENGKNYLMQIVRSIQNNQEFRAPIDQLIAPTYIDDLVNVLIDISLSKRQWIFHASSAESVSRFDFAKEVAQYLHKESLIKPCSLEDLKRSSPQAKRCVLNPSKELPRFFSWKNGIKKSLEKLNGTTKGILF